MPKTAKKVTAPKVEPSEYAPITGAWKRPQRISFTKEPKYKFADMKLNQALYVPSDIDPKKFKTPDEAKKAQKEADRLAAAKVSSAVHRFYKTNKNIKLDTQTVHTAVKAGLHKTSNHGILVVRTK